MDDKTAALGRDGPPSSRCGSCLLCRRSWDQSSAELKKNIKTYLFGLLLGITEKKGNDSLAQSGRNLTEWAIRSLLFYVLATSKGGRYWAMVLEAIRKHYKVDIDGTVSLFCYI